MAGIQADPDPLGMRGTVTDRSQVLEPGADLCPLSRHRLKKNRDLLISCNGLVKPADDIADPLLYPDPGMASRMEHQIFDSKRIHPRHILPDHRTREFIYPVFGAGKIHSIRRMGKQRPKPVLSSDLLEPCLFLLRIHLIIRSSGIPAEDLHGIRFHPYHVLGRLRNPLSDRHMRSYG